MNMTRGGRDRRRYMGKWWEVGDGTWGSGERWETSGVRLKEDILEMGKEMCGTKRIREENGVNGGCTRRGWLAKMAVELEARNGLDLKRRRNR